MCDLCNYATMARSILIVDSMTKHRLVMSSALKLYMLDADTSQRIHVDSRPTKLTTD